LLNDGQFAAATHHPGENTKVVLFLPQAVRATQTGIAGRVVLAGISLWSCVAIAISIRRHFLLQRG
jgi:hypothetical protein